MTAQDKRRGFALMTEARRREIAAEGGRAAHRQGVAHQYTSETGRKAGRLGGLAKRKGG